MENLTYGQILILINYDHCNVMFNNKRVPVVAFTCHSLNKVFKMNSVFPCNLTESQQTDLLYFIT